MRIKGFLGREYDPPAPFVRALLTSEGLGISKFMDFHIDTGASSTVILDKDFNYLKLNVSDLEKAERNMCGIGGLVDTYIIEDTTIVFKSEGGALHKERMPILVGVHKLDKLTNEEKKIAEGRHEDIYIGRVWLIHGCLND